MQVDAEVHETEVSRLDPENPSLALAAAGVVNVQAVIRPAIRRSAAGVRRVRARAPTNRQLFDLPPFRISDSSWQPCDRSWRGPELLPLLILQDLGPVSRGITQGPVATSLSAQPQSCSKRRSDLLSVLSRPGVRRKRVMDDSRGRHQGIAKGVLQQSHSWSIRGSRANCRPSEFSDGHLPLGPIDTPHRDRQ